MIIEHDLLPKQRTLKHSLKAEIDLFPLASELYEELDHIGFINRLKEVPQLGVIKVTKSLSKTRYDYIMLQLFFHQMIRKRVQRDLRLTYSSLVVETEFGSNYKYLTKDKPTIGDILQLLTIVYNVGHFYNTFTASRAITMLASKSQMFSEWITEASKSIRFHDVAVEMLKSKNYGRLHLLNSLLVLEQCDSTKQSVSLASEILYSYLCEDSLPEDCKLRYAFKIFREVRNVSYIAYDLQIADTPLRIDLCNEKAMVLLFKELLSEYNDNQSSISLVQSTSKMLDDTVYYDNSNAICYYRISRRIVSLMEKEVEYRGKSYYKDFFIDRNSILNQTYTHRKDYVQKHILKLTFPKEYRYLSEEFLDDVEKMNNTRVGYYDRHTGEQTVLVSIKNCNISAKRNAAFRILRCAIKYLRRIPNIKTTDMRFILCAKFFLYYLFDENPVVIKPTIDKEKCVICTRGKNMRIKALIDLLEQSVGTEDEKHEVEFMRTMLNQETTNDTTIMIPASILVFQKQAIGRTLCEFDGMIIFPVRKSEQVVFLEAKNRKDSPSVGKNCLREKFDKLSIEYSIDDICLEKCDAYYLYSVNK